MSGWRQPGCPVILASRSPRRRAILKLLGLGFTVRNPQVAEETFGLRSGSIAGGIRHLAEAKAVSVALRNPDALVLGADTVVVHNRRVLGKPRDAQDAARMLRALSDDAHTVCSAVALAARRRNFFRSAVEKTRVVFRKIDEEEIEWYLRTGEYRDKAGAYAIQGRALSFVKKISGCYYNVVGLPAGKTIDLFKAFAAERK
jgi:septum formation protein